MAKYNSTILLIAGACLIVITSGCISSNEQTQRSSIPTSYVPISTHASTPAPMVNQYSTMSFTEFYQAITSDSLTTLQKKNLYANKIFRWNGQVTDVTQDTVIVEIWDGKYYADTGTRELITIRLHVSDDQKSKLNSLSKGSITFDGTIPDINFNNLLYWGIDMYNGKIIG